MDGNYSLAQGEEGRFTLLRELFEHSEGLFVSIDMKDSTDELCQKVDELVREFKREDLTFWGSMFAEQHKTVQRLNPRVSCFYSGKQAMVTYLLWMCGCLWFCPLPSDALMTTHFTTRQMGNIKEMLRKKGKSGCCINLSLRLPRLIHLCSNGLFRHIKARNGTTIIWVVNH